FVNVTFDILTATRFAWVQISSATKIKTSPQIFIEPLERARPRELRCFLVITRCRVVVETVLFTVIHINLIDLVVSLERRLVCRNTFVDSLIVTGILQQQRRRDLRHVLDA